MSLSDGSLRKDVMDLSFAGLPEDVHLLVLRYLDAWDLLRCQMVSKAWRTTFLNLAYMRFMLKKHTSSRELRRLGSAGLSPTTVPDTDWNALFHTIASRYFHLTQGKARTFSRYKLAPCEQWGYWYPVGQFDFHESQPGGRLYHERAATHLSSLGDKPYLFRQTLWSYDDGLLVFPLASEHPTNDDCILFLLDLATDTLCRIPFSVRSRMIRNLRLRQRTLVIEWCEPDPYHNLTAMERVNRHFATCFDINTGSIGKTAVHFRCEWKLHFLGLPLTPRDRFFSTHTATRYCVYFWQPNRSMYTGDEENPIESLVIWDISPSSPYEPSQDPTGKRSLLDCPGPTVINRFSFHMLDFLGVRQRSNISLMSLHLDEASITIRENICVAGQGYFDPAERLWNARTTSFPIQGYGPPYRRVLDGKLPPYRGHCSMESANVEESERWFLPIMDVHDELADVRFSLIETCFTGASAMNRVMMRVKVMDEWRTMRDEVVDEVGGTGRIAGDERWVIGQNNRMELVIAKF